MDYKKMSKKIIELQKEKYEQIKTEFRMRNYINLFGSLIDILGNLNHLRKIIKELRQKK